jgi:gamma-glutamyltranspeptidase/glutathione hydrolase
MADLTWKAEGKLGAVAAGGAPATAAGLAILDRGGNAADAAVATIFALNVTDHGQCSIGGEAPLLIYSARDRQVKALCGQGRAPLSPEAIAWYLKHGIPGGGDIRMAPVPSVVDLCVTTLQRYGTLSLADVLPPTLALLDAGKEEWQPRLAVTLRRLIEEERLTSGSREEKLGAACDRFYGRHPSRNDIAEELEADYIAKGGFLRRADLAAHRTTIEEPAVAEYRGHTVCKCGPWTQGPFLLQALRLLEGFDLRAMGHLSADFVHAAVEAMKLALADRDEHYGDPDFVDVPLAALLSDAYTALRRPLIDMRRASSEARPGDPRGMKALLGPGAFRPGTGGTTTCVAADRWGNVVAATPSANVPAAPRDGGRAGVTFGNRLRSLNTTPGHPNCIAPGKRPRITLTPTLVLRAGRPVMAVSVAGGDLQDQVTLNLLLAAVDFGMSPEAAVTAPRFATAHHQDSFDPNPDRGRTFKGLGALTVNSGVDRRVRKELMARGHRLEVQGPGKPIGHPVMLAVDAEGGLLRAAGDPNAGRHAGAL